MKDFELIPHTADIKIRAYGHTMQELFKHALQGMFNSIRPHTQHCQNVNGRLVCAQLPCEHSVRVSSSDVELLLVDFLSEALYLSDVYDEVYLDVEIHDLNDHAIDATLKGVKVTGFEVVEIKAVTYNDLKIENVNGVWQADVVFDI